MGRFGPQHRKIPAPKRHGVRDPLKRLAERDAAIKDKINNPPKELDTQEVSQTFKRFLKLKEQAKNPASYRKKEHANIKIGSTVVTKLPKESEESFLDRASQIQEARKVEADFGVKFGVEVERNETTGAIKIRKRKGAEVDEMLNKKMDEKESNYKKRKPKAKKPTFAEKKAAKQQKEQERKQQEEDLLLKEYQYDYVPFGEVVQGPPTLHTLPRLANTQDGAARPGSKRLLLHSMLAPSLGEQEPSKAPKKSSKKPPPTKIDLKGKRKNLPIATRLKIEHEQQHIIEMYRKLKKRQ